MIDPSMPELADKGSPDNPFEKSWSEFTPKAGVRYRFNDDGDGLRPVLEGLPRRRLNGRPGTYEAAAIALRPGNGRQLRARLEDRVAGRPVCA